jgi:2-keto-3-deoxy-L-rhamnonate aldolase RhmA
MKPAQILKEKVSSGSLTLGVLATFHIWPGLVELVIRAGLDYLIIDLEHFTHGLEKVADLCAIGRMMGFPILVRPPAAELTHVRLAADLGPCGLLVPYVESTADLDVVRDAIYLKPRGKRRPGGPGNRWVDDLNYKGWKTQVEQDFIVLPQIESKAGLAKADAIAAHPITSALAMGPYDLSADLGICWQPEHPDLIGAYERIRSSAEAAGKQAWAIGDPAEMMARGFTFLCVGEPIMALEGLLTQLTANLRKARPSA